MTNNLLSQKEIDELMGGMEYAWEPTPDTLYGESDRGSYTLGMYFDRMTVERSKEGWHGALYIVSERDEDDGSFEYDIFPDDEFDMYTMVDEELFKTEAEAMKWCTDRDQHAVNP